jgi:hypothetical protein
LGLFCQKIVSFAAKLSVNLHFMKVSTENDNNFGYEKITILVDNIPLSKNIYNKMKKWKNINLYQKLALMKYR